jgi:hypothetical protein
MLQTSNSSTISSAGFAYQPQSKRVSSSPNLQIEMMVSDEPENYPRQSERNSHEYVSRISIETLV